MIEWKRGGRKRIVRRLTTDTQIVTKRVGGRTSDNRELPTGRFGPVKTHIKKEKTKRDRKQESGGGARSEIERWRTKVRQETPNKKPKKTLKPCEGVSDATIDVSSRGRRHGDKDL